MSDGVLECWSFMSFMSSGVLECWSAGVSEFYALFLRKSKGFLLDNAKVRGFYPLK